MAKLTVKQKEDYIKNGYSKCPKCKSYDIEGGVVDIHGNVALQSVSCNECEAEWEDTYKLADIHEITA